MTWCRRTGRTDIPRPLEAGLGCRKKQVPLRPQTLVSASAVARRLLRWVDLQDVSQQIGVLAVRTVALSAASILSLFGELRKTRYEKKRPFLSRCMLQELIFIESGAGQSWLKRHELPASNAAAGCEYSLLPKSLYLGKLVESVCLSFHQRETPSFSPCLFCANFSKLTVG